MTSKYEILKSYKEANHPEYVRDSWNNLGGAVITSTSRTYVKDMIYKITINGSGFNGAIILCEASLYSPDPSMENPSQFVDWTNTVVEDEDNGYFSFTKGIITPHFRLLLTPAEVDAIVTPVDTSFVPYVELTTPIITIDDEVLELILTEVGVPFILLEELEYPKQKICNNMIWPAMMDYYKYFPIIEREVIQSPSLTNMTFEVEMPSDAYGVARAQVLQGLGGPSSGGNPMHFFANEIAWWGGGAGMSAIRYNSAVAPGYANLQGFNTMMLDRAARQGIMNYATRAEFHVYKKNGKKYLKGYANRTGQLEIFWAKASRNWDDIEFSRQAEVRDLATARVMRALAMLRSQVKTDIPGTINYDMFANRAQALEDKVYEMWKSRIYPIAVRGTL